MSKLEEIKTSFAGKLEATRQQHAARLEADLQELRARLLREFKPSIPADLGSRLGKLAAPEPPAAPMVRQPLELLVDITASDQLRQIDEAFIQTFNLGAYYSVSRLHYQTKYCETLEEFYSPMIEFMDISPQARQAELQRLIAEAQEIARKQGGGVFGYNLPAKGAFINGWLLAFHQSITPGELFGHPQSLRRILEVAIHEKLGHGFLSSYSAFGEVKTRMGYTQFDIARRFGFQNADDPISSLRRGQSNLLFKASQLLEEGWASWVETYLAQSLLGSGQHPRYQIKKVVEAIQNLPENLPDRQEIQEALLGAILLLFGEEETPPEELLTAVLIMQGVLFRQGIEEILDELFAAKLGQPLRYAIGELILYQVELNLGRLCVPYAALIAANLNFDPLKLGLADMREILFTDPRQNPDARIAAISRLRPQAKDDVRGLAKMVTAQLSFSVPKELQG